MFRTFSQILQVWGGIVRTPAAWGCFFCVCFMLWLQTEPGQQFLRGDKVVPRPSELLRGMLQQ